MADLLKRVEHLPIAVAVAADLLRRVHDPLDEAIRGLTLEALRNDIHDVPDMLDRAVRAQLPEDLRLLAAMAVCSPDGV